MQTRQTKQLTFGMYLGLIFCGIIAIAVLNWINPSPPAPAPTATEDDPSYDPIFGRSRCVNYVMTDANDPIQREAFNIATTCKLTEQKERHDIVSGLLREGYDIRPLCSESQSTYCKESPSPHEQAVMRELHKGER
jgi:hypothetical protein